MSKGQIALLLKLAASPAALPAHVLAGSHAAASVTPVVRDLQALASEGLVEVVRQVRAPKTYRLTDHGRAWVAASSRS